MLETPIHRLATFHGMVITGLIAFVTVDVLPLINPSYHPLLRWIMLLEGMAVFQLLCAWYLEENHIQYDLFGLLLALFFLRLIYYASIGGMVSWPLRSINLHNAWLGFFGYALGWVGLHPRTYEKAAAWSQAVAAWPIHRRRWLMVAWFLGLAACFILFRSHHISRDGNDWIERTLQPIWHLYVREPLTIGLYRAVYLALQPWISLSTKDVIAAVSFGSGLAALVLFHRTTCVLTVGGFDRMLSWLIVLASGGMMIVFFGHIEVYPVLIAGIFATTYCAARYMQERSGIIPLALALSITFLSHLSTGWLLPAFFLLPWRRRESSTSRAADGLKLICVFGLVQALFWTGLVWWRYEGNLARFLARLFEYFHAGLDHAMFLPAAYWFDRWHLLDLAHEAIYLSLAGLILLPFSIYAAIRHVRRETWFWGGMLLGYSLYMFFWNPDRGYPEDWDLFSPILAPLVLFQIHTLLGGTESPSQARRWVYLVTLGILPFVLGQIAYHHTVPFVRY